MAVIYESEEEYALDVLEGVGTFVKNVYTTE